MGGGKFVLTLKSKVDICNDILRNQKKKMKNRKKKKKCDSVLQIDGWTDGWTNGRRDKQPRDKQTEGQTDGGTNRRRDKQTEGQTDGGTNRWRDKQTEEQTDGDQNLCLYIHYHLELMTLPIVVQCVFTALRLCRPMREDHCLSGSIQ